MLNSDILIGVCTLTSHERQVLSPPCRLGGLGIKDPTDIADQHYIDSLHANQPLIDTICEQLNEQLSQSVETIAAKKYKILNLGRRTERLQTQTHHVVFSQYSNMLVVHF